MEQNGQRCGHFQAVVCERCSVAFCFGGRLPAEPELQAAVERAKADDPVGKMIARKRAGEAAQKDAPGVCVGPEPAQEPTTNAPPLCGKCHTLHHRGERCHGRPENHTPAPATAAAKPQYAVAVDEEEPLYYENGRPWGAYQAESTAAPPAKVESEDCPCLGCGCIGNKDCGHDPPQAALDSGRCCALNAVGLCACCEAKMDEIEPAPPAVPAYGPDHLTVAQALALPRWALETLSTGLCYRWCTSRQGQDVSLCLKVGRIRYRRTGPDGLTWGECKEMWKAGLANQFMPNGQWVFLGRGESESKVQARWQAGELRRRAPVDAGVVVPDVSPMMLAVPDKELADIADCITDLRDRIDVLLFDSKKIDDNGTPGTGAGEHGESE